MRSCHAHRVFDPLPIVDPTWNLLKAASVLKSRKIVAKYSISLKNYFLTSLPSLLLAFLALLNTCGLHHN
jgi:hypothetical protein